MLKAYILVKIMISKRLIITFLSILVLLPQSACGPFKPKRVNAEKDVPINVRERVKKNMEEGKGFRYLRFHASSICKLQWRYSRHRLV